VAFSWRPGSPWPVAFLDRAHKTSMPPISTVEFIKFKMVHFQTAPARNRTPYRIPIVLDQQRPFAVTLLQHETANLVVRNVFPKRWTMPTNDLIWHFNPRP